MVTERRISGIDCDGPRQARRGRQAALDIKVRAGRFGTVDAVVPIELTVTDAEGNAAEGTGFYAARDGRLTVTLDIAPNDAVGTWRIEARDLASGQTATTELRVR